MTDYLSIKEYEIMNDLLLVSFALGNVYKDTPLVLKDSSFDIKGVQPVGYYGIRPFWGDGHNTGIFTVELLKELS